MLKDLRKTVEDKKTPIEECITKLAKKLWHWV